MIFGVIYKYNIILMDKFVNEWKRRQCLPNNDRQIPEEAKQKENGELNCFNSELSKTSSATQWL